MFTLNRIYRPITAQPFLRDETYIEIQPCKMLQPYVCCFWGTSGPYSNSAETEIKDKLVIPDTCMDIIFNMDMDKNELSDLFAGISDISFEDKPQSVKSSMSCFAIRFYSWAVPMFSRESMQDALNTFSSVEAYFKNFKRDLQDILFSNPFITDRAAKVEEYLLKKLDLSKQNSNVMNVLYKVLNSKGTANIAELARFTAISQRQLEKLFLKYVGVSPKKLSGLVRYQYLWQDILMDKNFNIHDSVYKYGYTDQSHLLNDFKKYHLLTPLDAKMFAYKTR
jgi:AraC-like DNA-binding protein